ncbi:hypothetical protein EYY85_14240 [Hafnia paralvei]|nr:hypothetical protein EYY85_14240 [Hafnia paralvei]
MAYDKAGQLIAETDFSGRALTYEYDNAGRCIRTRFPDGTCLNRQGKIIRSMFFVQIKPHFLLKNHTIYCS